MTVEEQQPHTEHKHLGTTMSGMAAGMLQDFKPVKNHDMHFNSIHGYADAPTRQVESNHYCGHLTQDFRQCLIYDSHDTYAAKLIGVEYIISREQYASLPPEEQAYWHSHKYEVCSGLLIMPGVPEMMEDSEMKKLGDTYGKTWHFWQVDRGDPLPYGPAKLMTSFTEDGQLNAQLLKLRDEKFKIDSMHKRERRMKYAKDFGNVHPASDKFNVPGLIGGSAGGTTPSQPASQQLHHEASSQQQQQPSQSQYSQSQHTQPSSQPSVQINPHAV